MECFNLFSPEGLWLAWIWNALICSVLRVGGWVGYDADGCEVGPQPLLVRFPNHPLHVIVYSFMSLEISQNFLIFSRSFSTDYMYVPNSY